MVRAEGVEGGLEAVEVALELLGLPPGAAVLEPDGHLARLQAQLARQLRLALRLQLVLLLEAPLQQMHLHVRAPCPSTRQGKNTPCIYTTRVA